MISASRSATSASVYIGAVQNSKKKKKSSTVITKGSVLSSNAGILRGNQPSFQCIQCTIRVPRWTREVGNKISYLCMVPIGTP